ncbi:alpha-2-HS-glycoprotein [Rana temporaria]|uniref:alpha-2-HS-glycoprotein n=1 Tax=Rana temporaria TaxID=8407 RepID=UPI001AAD585F|nr:alpha-2-HS-glycoprotein [Rana temporaria]
MNLLLETLLLANLVLCSGYVVPSNTPVLNCDDEEAHQAAAEAVRYTNAHHHNGYLFALNRVEKIIPLPSHGGDEIYLFELDLLETVCPHVSSTPIEQCPVRAKIEQAVEADCDYKMRKHNNTYEVLQAKCKSELKSAEKLPRVCPNCPHITPLNDTRVVHAVDVALHKFNSGNTTNFYSLQEIGRGRIQQGVGNTAIVEFIAAATNCSKEDAASGLNKCVKEDGPKARYAACSASVVKVPGVADEDVVETCTIHEAQPQKDAQAPLPGPVAPVPHHFIPSRFHHNLHFNNLSPHSSESNSAEQHLLAAHAQRAVKRSLTGKPVHANVRRLPLCPGRKIHF